MSDNTRFPVDARACNARLRLGMLQALTENLICILHGHGGCSRFEPDPTYREPAALEDVHQLNAKCRATEVGRRACFALPDIWTSSR